MEKSEKCLMAIQQQEKQHWIESLGLAGSSAELRYIEELQQEYARYREHLNGDQTLMNSLIRLILNGPGIMSLICKSIQF